MGPEITTLGTDLSPAARRRRIGGLHPQHLGHLSLALDAGLFAAAAIASWLWSDADYRLLTTSEEADLLVLARALCSVLLLAVFLGCCRFAGLHRPLILLRETGWLQTWKAVLCFSLPPLAVLVLCVLSISAPGAATQVLVDWLERFAALAAALAIVSRQAFLVSRPWLQGGVLAPQRIAIVGSGEAASRMISRMEESAPELFHLVGVFEDRDVARTAQSKVAALIRGTTTDLISLYQRSPFDKILIALPHSAEERLVQLLRRLRQLPVDIVLAPDLVGFHCVDQVPSDVAGLKLQTMAGQPIREPQRLVKGAIDRTLSAIALLILSPLMLLVTIAIKLDSPGPVLFRQPRQGLGDTMFDVFKFRTMYQDRGDRAGHQQTSRQDPRVTRLGAFLRRTSIDELPQLFNVLRGEMSLVGPRPHTPHMLIGGKRIFDIVDEYSFRHRVKPGITGLAQVNGYRGAVDTPEHLRARIDFDLYYIDHWSLWLDIKIILRTAFICVRGANAF